MKKMKRRVKTDDVQVVIVTTAAAMRQTMTLPAVRLSLVIPTTLVNNHTTHSHEHSSKRPEEKVWSQRRKGKEPPQRTGETDGDHTYTNGCLVLHTAVRIYLLPSTVSVDELLLLLLGKGESTSFA